MASRKISGASFGRLVLPKEKTKDGQQELLDDKPSIGYRTGSSLYSIAAQSLLNAFYTKPDIHFVYEKLKTIPECLPRVVGYLHDHFDKVVSDSDGFFASSSDDCSRIDRIVSIQTNGENNIPIIELYGSRHDVDLLANEIRNLISDVGPLITWVYDRYMRTVEMPLNMDHLPINEMYPFVNKPLDDYYKEFYDSSSNVMICLGEPGTGKTTFLRGMLKSLNSSAILSYQQDIFECDEFFVKFLTSDIGIMIIEDADVLLSARQDGNSAMQRFLNAADGLVTIPKRKLVFTTNLPNVNNIDPALVRSGRCFDVLKFRKLQPDEIQSLRGVVGLQDNPLFSKPQTLATVMNARPSC